MGKIRVYQLDMVTGIATERSGSYEATLLGSLVERKEHEYHLYIVDQPDINEPGVFFEEVEGKLKLRKAKHLGDREREIGFIGANNKKIFFGDLELSQVVKSLTKDLNALATYSNLLISSSIERSRIESGKGIIYLDFNNTGEVKNLKIYQGKRKINSREWVEMMRIRLGDSYALSADSQGEIFTTIDKKKIIDRQFRSYHRLQSGEVVISKGMIFEEKKLKELEVEIEGKRYPIEAVIDLSCLKVNKHIKEGAYLAAEDCELVFSLKENYNTELDKKEGPYLVNSPNLIRHSKEGMKYLYELAATELETMASDELSLAKLLETIERVGIHTQNPQGQLISHFIRSKPELDCMGLGKGAIEERVNTIAIQSLYLRNARFPLAGIAPCNLLRENECFFPRLERDYPYHLRTNLETQKPNEIIVGRSPFNSKMSLKPMTPVSKKEILERAETLFEDKNLQEFLRSYLEKIERTDMLLISNRGAASLITDFDGDKLTVIPKLNQEILNEIFIKDYQKYQDDGLAIEQVKQSKLPKIVEKNNSIIVNIEGTENPEGKPAKQQIIPSNFTGVSLSERQEEWHLTIYNKGNRICQVKTKSKDYRYLGIALSAGMLIAQDASQETPQIRDQTENNTIQNFLESEIGKKFLAVPKHNQEQVGKQCLYFIKKSPEFSVVHFPERNTIQSSIQVSSKEVDVALTLNSLYTSDNKTGIHYNVGNACILEDNRLKDVLEQGTWDRETQLYERVSKTYKLLKEKPSTILRQKTIREIESLYEKMTDTYSQKKPKQEDIKECVSLYRKILIQLSEIQAENTQVAVDQFKSARKPCETTRTIIETFINYKPSNQLLYRPREAESSQKIRENREKFIQELIQLNENKKYFEADYIKRIAKALDLIYSRIDKIQNQKNGISTLLRKYLDTDILTDIKEVIETHQKENIYEQNLEREFKGKTTCKITICEKETNNPLKIQILKIKNLNLIKKGTNLSINVETIKGERIGIILANHNLSNEPLGYTKEQLNFLETKKGKLFTIQDVENIRVEEVKATFNEEETERVRKEIQAKINILSQKYGEESICKALLCEAPKLAFQYMQETAANILDTLSLEGETIPLKSTNLPEEIITHLKWKQCQNPEPMTIRVQSKEALRKMDIELIGGIPEHYQEGEKCYIGQLEGKRYVMLGSSYPEFLDFAPGTKLEGKVSIGMARLPYKTLGSQEESITLTTEYTVIEEYGNPKNCQVNVFKIINKNPERGTVTYRLESNIKAPETLEALETVRKQLSNFQNTTKVESERLSTEGRELIKWIGEKGSRQEALETLRAYKNTPSFGTIVVETPAQFNADGSITIQKSNVIKFITDNKKVSTPIHNLSIRIASHGDEIYSYKTLDSTNYQERPYFFTKEESQQERVKKLNQIAEAIAADRNITEEERQEFEQVTQKAQPLTAIFDYRYKGKEHLFTVVEHKRPIENVSEATPEEKVQICGIVAAVKAEISKKRPSAKNINKLRDQIQQILGIEVQPGNHQEILEAAQSINREDGTPLQLYAVCQRELTFPISILQNWNTSLTLDSNGVITHQQNTIGRLTTQATPSSRVYVHFATLGQQLQQNTQTLSIQVEKVLEKPPLQTGLQEHISLKPNITIEILPKTQNTQNTNQVEL